MNSVRRVSIGERMTAEMAVEVRLIKRDVRGEGEVRMSEEWSGMLRMAEMKEELKVSRVRRTIL